MKGLASVMGNLIRHLSEAIHVHTHTHSHTH